MADKRLKEDYIQWTLNLNASQAQQEYQKLQKSSRELVKEQNRIKESLRNLERHNLKGSESYQSLLQDLKNVTDGLSTNKAQMQQLQSVMKTSDMTAAQLAKRLKTLQLEFRNTSRATEPERYAELQRQIRETKTALDEATASVTKTRTGFLSLTSIQSTLTGFFTGIGLMLLSYVTNGFKSAFNTIVEFEKANSKLAAVLGTTKADIKDLTDEARRLGATTSYTASEVTSLQIELAKLGFSKEQIKEMESGVLKFAKAVDTDLASAAAFAGASMRIFHIDASRVDDMLATLAIGTNKSALNFSFLSTAMSTVGPVANAFGFSIEETTALLGALADAGFDASSAATATRNILLNLADSNGQLAQALGAPVNNLDDLVAGLQKLTAEGIDLNKALELTDKRSVSAFSSFIENAGHLTELRDSVTDCTGAFNAMSDEMGDNVQGSLNILSSTVEGVILRFYEARGPLKDLIDALTVAVEWVGKAIGYIQEYSTAIKILIIAWGSYRIAMLAIIPIKKLYISLANKGLKTSMAEMTLLKAKTVLHKAHRATLYASAMANALLAGNVTTAKIAMQHFNAVVKANPIGLLISAVSLLAVAYTTLSKRAEVYEKIEKQIAEQDQKHQEIRNAHSRSREELADNIATEKQKLLELEKIAANENISKERRLKAIEKLNRIIPDYNAHLDKESGLYVRNTEALDKYIASMERSMKVAYYKDDYEKYIKEIEAAKRNANKIVRDKVQPAISMWLKKSYSSADTNSELINNDYMRDKAWREMQNAYREGNLEDRKGEYAIFFDAVASWNQADLSLSELNADFSDLKVDMIDAGVKIEDILGNVEDSVTSTVNAADNAVRRLKEINAELKQLGQGRPKNDKELAEVQARIKALQEERKTLLGNKKTSTSRAPTLPTPSIRPPPRSPTNTCNG